MNGFLPRLVCVIAFLTQATISRADGLIAPLSWSPDSRWLCYTALEDPSQAILSADGLFGRASDRPEAVRSKPITRQDPAAPVVYRIWAADQTGRTTVLIEESRWPLSAPAWGPRGRSLAFSRFIPQSGEPAGPTQQGRLDVVVQRGLEEKAIVWSSPEFVMDEITRAALPYHRPAWSPDGIYLAVPRPGRVPSVDVIRTDSRKRVHILDHAILPTWSPDGSVCAFIRGGIGNNSLEIIRRRGQVFSEPRELLSTGAATAAPVWSSDGRSILIVSEKTTRPNRDLELVRCPLDASEPARVLNLLPDPLKRVAKLRGIAIDFDKDAEMSFHAADLENRESEVISTSLRDSQLHGRFHPVDPCVRIGALAASPDGHCVAVRLGDPLALSHPALYNTDNDQTRLLVPDESARREWLMLLSAAAERLLKGALPSIIVDGCSFERPTNLPLPGELAGGGNEALRVGRIAELARVLSPARGEPAERFQGDTQARLLFNYLRGDYSAASADLELLDSETTDVMERQGLLGLRALCRWARGDLDESRQMIEYLVSTTGLASERVEDTPLGPVITKFVSPEQAWARFLSVKAAQARATAQDLGEGIDNVDPLGGPGRKPLLELPDFPQFQPGGAAGPFAPLPAPDVEPAERPK